ncbi:hypothetical protein R3P38DRAFT_3404589 [Favolaschia claudopus]|uniref:Uncharacterized protein n=1 Tax=Favolaschia claudopus TaxID=2862362 RepID=A0AAW0AAS1_9AGAR
MPEHENPSRSRRQVEPLRMKQEPNDHNANFGFPAAQPHQQSHPSLVPQSRIDQAKKLRAFTMNAPSATFHEHPMKISEPHFDSNAPQYASSPKITFETPAIQSYSNPPSQDPRRSSSVLQSRSPSVQIEEDYDAEDADLSQLMTKRMREAKIVKTKLAEQRLATAALESRLSALTSASEASELALRNRISELEARETSRSAKTQEEVRTARTRTEVAEQKLQDAVTAMDELRKVAKTGLVEAKNNYITLQAVLKDLKSDYDVSQDTVGTLRNELNELRRSAMDALKGIDSSDGLSRNEETRALIDELQSDRVNAYQVIDMLRDKLHLLGAQVVEAKERIVELEASREGKIERAETRIEELADRLAKKEEAEARGLANAEALEVRLNESNDKLVKVSKTLEEKEVDLGTLREQKAAREWELKEKCSKIASLQSVSTENAALREQIVTLESQMKDLKDKEMSLEWDLKEKSSKLASLQSVSTENSALREQTTALESQVRELKDKKMNLEWDLKEKSSKITSLQSVSADNVVLREQIITLECQVKGLKDEKMALEYQAKEDRSRITALQSAESELVVLRAEKVEFEFEVKESRFKLATLQDSQQDLSANLQVSRDHGEQQETQLIQLRDQLRVLETTKAQLQASLEAAQLAESKISQDAYALRQEVGTVTVREAVLKERAAVSQQKCEEIVVQLGKVSVEASAREEELRRLNIEHSVLQDRFESQAQILKATQDTSKELQERLLMSERSHASAVGKVNAELAVLREQSMNLELSLTQATDELAAQRDALTKASREYENKASKQEEVNSKLVLAEERRATLAEKEVVEAKRQVEDLVQQVEDRMAEVEEVKRKMREVASRENVDVDGRVVVLQARLEEVEVENSRLQQRARNLNRRYQDGDLSDTEKSFVNSLMQISQSIHEQDVVAKENELRRRENMITSLQTRIDTLESTLARLLKERAKEGDPNSKSIVDLNLWMSSSPRSAEKKAAATDSKRTVPPSPKVSGPDTPLVVKKSSKTTGAKSSASDRSHRTLTAIDEDDDEISNSSDDDVPISTTIGKRSRTPVAAAVPLDDEEDGRPARRLRVTSTRKGDTESRKVEGESSKKLADGAKSKQRKRR